MKKILMIFGLSLLLTACGGKSELDNEQIEKQIFEYKEQVAELNKKIDELEAKLSIGDNTQNLKVTVREIQPRYFEHHFEVSGTVEAIRHANISPEMNGQIKRIHIKEGQRVSKGQLLVSLNSNVLQKSIDELETGLELTKTIYEKQKELWDKNIGTEVQYLEAKTNYESMNKKLKSLNAQLKMTKIYAPFSGIVDEINQKEGEMGSPGFPMLQLVDLSELYVNADVSEKYLSSLEKGDSTWLHFPSYPMMEVPATIYRTGNIVKEGNRTFKIQIKLNNINNKLKPNILSIVKLIDFTVDDAILAPSIIIKQDINGKYLYKISETDGQEIAKKIYIKTGVSNEKYTMITEGLKTGDKIITQGYHLVKDGTPVSY